MFCAKAGIKHVFGYSFTLEEEGETAEMKIYVQTQTGLQNLLHIQKEIMADNPKHTLSLESLLQYAGGNVLVFGADRIDREAHRRNIATGVGRGSAGGSLVACLLGITSIDPIKYDLLFSRFLVPERCGLKWTDEITHTGKECRIEAGAPFVEVRTDEGCLCLNTWAKLHVQRNSERISVYPDELREGDEILFDNRDKLWNLNDIIR